MVLYTDILHTANCIMQAHRLSQQNSRCSNHIHEEVTNLDTRIKEVRCYEAKIEESEKARCVTEAFSTTCAVYIEDCEGWWLSGCRGSVAEHWRLKPEVSWV